MQKRNNALVSIILTTYNGQDYVTDQLNSILSQTYKTWELIICDDKSNDKTINIIKKFAYENPSNTKLLLGKQNVGLIKNFSRGLPHVNGEYIAVCDVDDVWLPTKLEKQLNLFESYPGATVCHHDLQVVDEKLNILDKSLRVKLGVPSPKKYLEIKPFRKLIDKNFITAPSVVFRKSLLKNLSTFPTCFPQDYWIALVGAACGDILYINEGLVKYRQRPGNMQGARVNRMPHYLVKLFSKSTGENYLNQIPILEAAYTRLRLITDSVEKQEAVDMRLDFLKLTSIILSRNNWYTSVLKLPKDYAKIKSLRNEYLRKSALYFTGYKLNPIKKAI